MTGRSTYHHGNLRAALLAAGVELAREAGPDAVVLRETTRRAGVSPNAAYRHFADREALLVAVRAEAMAALGLAIEAELAGVEGSRRRLHACGTAYVMFAVGQPGLFRTAFSGPGATGTAGPGPYELLGRCLDDLVAEGELTAVRREGAEVAAWAAVHGLATLLVDGPLRSLDPQQRDAVLSKVLEVTDAGL